MQKITPFLWFDGNAEEAVDFYCSVFKDAKKNTAVADSGSNSAPKGKPLTVSFDLFGQTFVALNGGPMFKFTEAVSFVINCESQEEVDYYWDRLTSEGGQPSRCGWLKDKFGLSWQVVPTQLSKLLGDKDKAGHVMKALMQMDKLDIGVLQRAHDEE